MAKVDNVEILSTRVEGSSHSLVGTAEYIPPEVLDGAHT